MLMVSFAPARRWPWTFYLERGERLLDLARQLDVRVQGRAIAARMVVHEDDGGGGKLQRAAGDLARIDRRMIDRALSGLLVCVQLVLAVEIEDAGLFDLLVPDPEADVVEQPPRWK